MFPETGWVNFQVWIPYSSLGLLVISEFLLYSGYEPYMNAEHYMYYARLVFVHDSNDESACLNKNCQLKIGKLAMIGTYWK